MSQATALAPDRLPLSALLGQRGVLIPPHAERRTAQRAAAGPVPAHRAGAGAEPRDTRPWVAGDDLRHIDWRTSARVDDLLTRSHHQDTDHSLSIALDGRAAMFTGSRQMAAVALGLFAARLLWLAAESELRAQLLWVDESGVDGVPAARGAAMASQACHLIAERFAEREGVDDSAGSGDLGGLWRHWDGDRSRGARLLLSNLANTAPPPGAFAHGRPAAPPLCVLWWRDPLERDGLPPGNYPLGGRRHRLDRRAAAQLRDALADRAAQTADRWRAAGAEAIAVDSLDDAPVLVERLYAIGVLV